MKGTPSELSGMTRALVPLMPVPPIGIAGLRDLGRAFAGRVANWSGGL